MLGLLTQSGQHNSMLESPSTTAGHSMAQLAPANNEQRLPKDAFLSLLEGLEEVGASTPKGRAGLGAWGIGGGVWVLPSFWLSAFWGWPSWIPAKLQSAALAALGGKHSKLARSSLGQGSCGSELPQAQA